MNVHDQRPAVDATLFRRVMGRFASGVTVITAGADGEVRGMTANAFMSGSLEPPLCVISVAVKAHMHGHLLGAGRFGVSILAKGQESISAHFAGHSLDHLHAELERVGQVPLLKGASAVIAAETQARHDCGDHSLFVGHIIGMRDDGLPPLLFHGGKYATLHYKKTEAAAEPIDFWELPHD
jgi:flavin reductase (DIM6/NTAB) family NADH-FMN oxidoreductase RutF